MTTRLSSRHRLIAMALSAALVPGSASTAIAAELQPHTVRAFDEYVRLVETRTAAEQHAARGFLGIEDVSLGKLAALRVVLAAELLHENV